MAMFLVVPVLAFFGSISGVFGQFACSTAAKAGTPKCRMSTSASCRANECCVDGIECAGTPAGERKARCTANKMFSKTNRKQMQSDLATAGDVNYVATCCVDCTAAKCSDWAYSDSTTFSCAANTERIMSTDPVLASASACVAPGQDVYRSTCCQPTCGASGTGSRSRTEKNTACGADNYFAPTYGESIIVASVSDTDFKSACCTLCTTITCGNLKLMYSDLTCVSPASVKSDVVYTPSLVACAKPEVAAFRTGCCGRQCGSGTSSTCGATKILDQTKSQNYAADGTDEKFITACCKDCTAGLCSDWTTPTCATGAFNGAIALAGAASCAEPNAEAKKVCCETQMLCSAWVADASAALPTCFPFIGTLLASLAVVLGVDCL